MPERIDSEYLAEVEKKLKSDSLKVFNNLMNDVYARSDNPREIVLLLLDMACAALTYVVQEMTANEESKANCFKIFLRNVSENNPELFQMQFISDISKDLH